MEWSMDMIRDMGAIKIPGGMDLEGNCIWAGKSNTFGMGDQGLCKDIVKFEWEKKFGRIYCESQQTLRWRWDKSMKDLEENVSK